MALRIGHLSVDARDAYAQSRWWAEVLGWSEDPEDPNLPGHEECMIFAPLGSSRHPTPSRSPAIPPPLAPPAIPPPSDRPERLLFIEVPEAKTVKNRLHLDLVPTDRRRDDEVVRLLGLGAREVADHRLPDGSGWVTLADPEGNELCVLRSDAERLATPD